MNTDEFYKIKSESMDYVPVLLEALNKVPDNLKHEALMVALAFIAVNGSKPNNMTPAEIIDLLHKQVIELLEINPIELFTTKGNDENTPSSQ